MTRLSCDINPGIVAPVWLSILGRLGKRCAVIIVDITNMKMTGSCRKNYCYTETIGLSDRLCDFLHSRSSQEPPSDCRGHRASERNVSEISGSRVKLIHLPRNAMAKRYSSDVPWISPSDLLKQTRLNIA